MFVCYLDDSDADVESSVVTLSGYVRHIANWERYERHATKVYEHYGITELHAMDLHHARRQFKGWDPARKNAFVDDLFAHPTRDLLGIGVSVRKEAYKQIKKGIKSASGSSAYGSAFGSMLFYLINNSGGSGLIHDQGISFIVEAGHKNNADLASIFARVKKKPYSKGCLRTLAFSSKQESKAIQLADLNAYYTRRLAARLDKIDGPTREQIVAAHDPIYRKMVNKYQNLHWTIHNAFAELVTMEEYEARRAEGKEDVNFPWTVFGSEDL